MKLLNAQNIATKINAHALESIMDTSKVKFSKSAWKVIDKGAYGVCGNAHCYVLVMGMFPKYRFKTLSLFGLATSQAIVRIKQLLNRCCNDISSEL